MSKLRTSIADGVFTITLDDLPANTYSYEMMQQLDAAVLAALERELQQRLFERDDVKEGLQASLEKREPNFSGR